MNKEYDFLMRNASCALVLAEQAQCIIRTDLFKFCFFAVKRIDPQAKAERKEVYATDLKSAKLQLVRDYVLSLASQTPAGA